MDRRLAIVILCWLGLFSPVMAQPVVNLGPDVVQCGGPVILNAQNPGASYLWSTGDTSQTIAVGVTGTYWVQVTNLSGTGSDTVKVQVVTIPATPLIPDTTVCGFPTITLASGISANIISWRRDSLSGTLLGQGPNLPFPVPGNSTLVVQGLNYGGIDSVGYVSPAAAPPGGNYFPVAAGRGIRFDVLKASTLVGVTVFSSANATAKISLTNSAGTVLHSKSVSGLVQGANVVALGFPLTVGTNFRLVLETSTGNFFVVTSAVYPQTNSMVALRGGHTLAGQFTAFFNWKIAAAQCAGGVDTTTITSQAIPTIDLGNDTIFCGTNLLLDVTGSGGSSYLWNDGSTNSSLLASTSGLYWVEGSLGQCTTRDSVEIELVAFPSASLLTDTTVCGFPTITLASGISASLISWRRDSLSGPLIGQGPNLNFSVPGNSTLLVQSLNYGGLDSAGYLTPAVAPPGGSYLAVPAGRGIRFDVLKASTLVGVTVFSSAGATAKISLTNSAGTVLHSKEVSGLVQGANVVSLGFPLTVGTNFRLVLETSAGNFFTVLSAVYPQTNSMIALRGGHPLANQYIAFFNWKVAAAECPAEADTILVVSQPIPVLDLGSDTVVCGTTLLLDVTGSGGSSYLWNNGNTTSSLTANTTGLYWVEGALGQCTARDSVFLELIPVPASPVLTDTTLCGSQSLLLNGVNNANMVLWYNQLAGGTLLNQSAQFEPFVKDTTTYFVERVNLPSLTTVGLANPNAGSGGGYFAVTAPRGINFQLTQPRRLISVDVFAQSSNPGGGQVPEATLVVRNTSGTEIYRQRHRFPISGANRVILNLDLPVGNNYQLLLEEGTGNYYLVFSYSYPPATNGIRLTGGTPLITQYGNFFNWRWADKVCSVPRTPVTVNIKLPNQLTDSLYACSPATLQGPTGATSYLWSTGATMASIVVDNTQTYSVTADDGQGCVVTYEIGFAMPRQIDLGPDGNFCGDLLSSGYGPDATILWSTGDTTPTITTNLPGIYWVSLTEPNGCFLTDTVSIASFTPNPVVNLGNDTSVCVSLQLASGLPSLTHTWSNGASSPVITVQASGLYSVVVTDPFGCQGRDTIGVAVTQIPTANFSFDTTALTASFFNASGFGNYLWDFGDSSTSTQANPVHTYNLPGDYTVRLIVGNQCGKDTLELVVAVRNPTVGLAAGLLPFRWEIRYGEALAVWVEGQASSQPLTIEMLTLTGQLLERASLPPSLSDQTAELPVSGLSPGYYLLRLRAGQRSETRSFVVR